jgi:protein-L-isoaspartate O-methyltransferase
MSYQNLFPMHAVAKEAGGSLPGTGGHSLSSFPSLLPGRKQGWFSRLPNRQFLRWARQQLNIQPYQHLLEVGYGAGHLTAEVASALRIGFIAGIEPSIPLYQQAYRRNKRFVRQQLLQLHIGELYELSYPPHYFHTIYGTNIHLFGKDFHSELLRLSSLLKSRGRLVLLLEAGRDRSNIQETALQLRKTYQSVGLSVLHTELYPFNPDNYLAITGFKA